MTETEQNQIPSRPSDEQLVPVPLPAVSPSYTSALPTTTNVWAVVSLISSILSWLGLFGVGGIVGIIAGVVARREIAASRGTQNGDGMALVGIILGAINIVGTCLFALCMFTLVLGTPLLFLPFGEGR